MRDVSCDDGQTVKSLARAHDGTLVESVLMSYPGRVTVCVSSQAGCGMACPFCATGQAGLTRNLSAGEIVDQVVTADRAVRAGALGPDHERVTNVVFMGMGEPLANYARVRAAVRAMTAPAPDGLGLSRRSIVVSTVGLVPAIEKLIDDDLGVTLAVSLHAPDDELRDTLVPVNTRWPLREVLAAAFRWTEVTGRRLSIEYALIRDVNDQPWRADLLGKRLRGKDVHVNLIPLNPTPGSRWDASAPEAQDEFVARLRAQGVVDHRARHPRARRSPGPAASSPRRAEPEDAAGLSPRAPAHEPDGAGAALPLLPGAQGLDQLVLGHLRTALDVELLGPAVELVAGPLVVGRAVAALHAGGVAVAVRDGRGLALAHALLAQRLVLLVVLDGRPVVGRHARLLRCAAVAAGAAYPAVGPGTRRGGRLPR